MNTQYCSKCGSILQEKVEPANYKDVDNGKDVYKRYLQCPKYPGLLGHIFGFSSHTTMLVRFEYANNVGMLDEIFEQPEKKKRITKNKSKRRNKS
jgi:hypothetical protein